MTGIEVCEFDILPRPLAGGPVVGAPSGKRRCDICGVSDREIRGWIDGRGGWRCWMCDKGQTAESIGAHLARRWTAAHKAISRYHANRYGCGFGGESMCGYCVDYYEVAAAINACQSGGESCGRCRACLGLDSS